MTKTKFGMWGRFILLHRLPSIVEGSQGRQELKAGRNLEAGTKAEAKGKCAGWLAPLSLLSLVSYTLQDHPAQGWHLPRWAKPSASIVNQEDAPEACPQVTGTPRWREPGPAVSSSATSLLPPPSSQLGKVLPPPKIVTSICCTHGSLVRKNNDWWI